MTSVFNEEFVMEEIVSARCSPTNAAVSVTPEKIKENLHVALACVVDAINYLNDFATPPDKR